MNSPSLIAVFILGGLLCVAAQLLIDLTSLTPARILVLYVTLGVLIYAVGLFDPLKEFFGTGITLPLVGFGANIARGVKEAIDSTGPIGILTGGLSASAAGITAALISGFSAAILSKSRSKRM